MRTVSIVGFGRFGKTLYRLLRDDFTISIFDEDQSKYEGYILDPKDRFLTDEKDLFVQSDLPHAIFYAVPIPAFKSIIETHKPRYRKNHILIDVLSVKTHPQEIFESVLEGTDTQVILTHPMFGPDSSKDGFQNLPIVVSNHSADEEEYDFWKELFNKKGLQVKELSPEEHDKLAANSQGITHFIGRMLGEFDIQPTPIDTLGAIKLQEVKEQTCNDTWELFTSLQNYNPETKQMRTRLGSAYDKIYNQLLPKRIDPQKLTIGIQGGKGSFNEEALHHFIKKNKIKDEIQVEYLYTTENVLAALYKGDIDQGQFAMHNSVGGIVEESIHAAADYKFEIIEEFAIKISHHIMKRKDVATEDITKFMTHPQVRKQCRSNLEKKYSHMEITSGEGDLIDHANVAKALAEGEIDKTTAVIGPKILAELYDLDVIDSDLQDAEENFTSFMMVRRKK